MAKIEILTEINITDGKYVSKSTFAAIIGVSSKTVYNYMADKENPLSMAISEDGKRVDLTKGVHLYQEYLKKYTGGIDARIKRAKEIKILKEIELLEINARNENGKYVPLETIEKEHKAALDTLRQVILSWVDTLAFDFTEEPNPAVIKRAIETEAHGLLDQIVQEFTKVEGRKAENGNVFSRK
ncbi:MAG: hypothetical protein HQK89_02255 [Nitrospirae bacterium]|nr:hypothetical protein [Nitrospirota bacterium]